MPVLEFLLKMEILKVGTTTTIGVLGASCNRENI